MMTKSFDAYRALLTGSLKKLPGDKKNQLWYAVYKPHLIDPVWPISK